MWMDWDNDYYTFSDTNIEYIWRFLKEVHRRGWLFQGHRSTQWCPRCGTSLSQHEQAGEGNYEELDHPSLYVRFPLKAREGESLVVWTTTPWTLPANVAAAVRPEAEYGLRDGGWRLAETGGEYEHVVRGEELVGLEYEGPFDDLEPQAGVVHRVIPWDEVALDEGSGIVHIAPGAGTEDFELSKVHDLPVLVPIDESGRFYPQYGRFAGMTTGEVEEPVIESLRERGLLVEAGRITHRYPICWRCRTPLVFRVVDDWFIGVDDVREQLREENRTVEWTPPQYGKRMDDWLANMGDWNISRKRYFGLPLPFYPCSCGHLNVIGSRAELEERAVSGLDQLQELHRPWIDEVPIRCESCGVEVRADPGGRGRLARRGDRPALHARVGEPALRPGRVRHRGGRGADGRRPPRPCVLGEVVSRRLDLGDAGADPALVLLAVLHVGDAGRPVAVPTRAHLREAPRRDRTRDAPLVGKRDRRQRGVRPHGRRRDALAVLRDAAGAEPEVRVRPGGRGQAAAAHALELRFLLRHLREHRGLPADVRGPGRRSAGGAAARPLGRRPCRAARRRGVGGLRPLLDAGGDARLRAVRRRSVELVHPPLAAPLLLVRRGRVQDAVVRARPGTACDRAGDAVPRRRAVAEPGCGRVRGRAGLGAPGRLARARRGRHRASGRGRRAPRGGRARPTGPRGRERQAAPAAAAGLGVRIGGGAAPSRRDQGGAPGQGGRAPGQRTRPLQLQAEPARARPEARPDGCRR